ncbi:MAG: hypothetical protein V3R78_14325 [Thermodesulfobacteriota bacterium]
MIIVIWSDHDGTQIEEFGEGLDGTVRAEARILELHNLAASSDSHATTIDMVIRGQKVVYEVKEVAFVIKIKNQL